VVIPNLELLALTGCSFLFPEEEEELRILSPSKGGATIVPANFWGELKT
jgi:hypothetical protein